MEQITNALRDLSTEELESVVELVKAEKARRREEAKAEAEALSEQRAEFAEQNIVPDEDVRFMFGKAEYTGKVIRKNKATFTVEFELNGETVKRYVKPHRILGPVVAETV